MPAKRPTWKDSKYADAKGKFKSLSLVLLQRGLLNLVVVTKELLLAA